MLLATEKLNQGNVPSLALLTEKTTEVMGALLQKTKFRGTLRACEEPETENKMRSIFYGIAVVIKLSKGSLTRWSVNFGKILQNEGL